MTWQLFCEINRSLFPWPEKPWRITFWKAAAWLVATCGLVGAYYHAPDAAVHRLITALVNFPALKSEDAILSWDHGNHTPCARARHCCCSDWCTPGPSVLPRRSIWITARN